MAQICVVNCFSCEVFQGQLIKKGTKWTCKMCGEMQSFKKIFAQGSGKECRQVVQKLNMMSGNLKRKMLEEIRHEEDGTETREKHKIHDQDSEDCFGKGQTKRSKWNQFISSDTAEMEEAENHNNEDSYTTERITFNSYKPQKQKKEIRKKNLGKIYQRKIPRFNNSKETYPGRMPNKTYSANFDQEYVEVEQKISPETNCINRISPQPQKQTVPSTSKTTCAQKKFSKWSKYTL